MKSISKILMAITILLSINISNAQIKNAKTESVKIFGNCGMCETKIEKAGNIKKVAKVDWDKNTQMAALTYDATKTNPDEILKRIALVGYDSDKFLAPDNAYSKLDKCCQYERVNKAVAKSEEPKMEIQDHSAMTEKQYPSDSEQAKQTNKLKAVFDNYFTLKDALVKTDGNAASKIATDLLTAINEVKMETLKSEEHLIWMKVINNLKEHSEHISETKDISHQRDHFMDLSKNIYELMKVSKTETPIYYQFCPMANDGKGANWLSKENKIKNPYYGSMMMSCGKTVETIK